VTTTQGAHTHQREPAILAARRTSEADGPPADQPPDEVLIQQSLLVAERFGPLFDRHATVVHRYLARRIGPDADDLLAETFLIAFRQRATYRKLHVDVRPWLFGIATNVLRRHARQEKRRYQALARAAVDRSGEPHATDDAVGRLDAQSLRRDLSAALAALNRGDRDVLLLTAWAELSYAEIAAVLNIPVGTVRSRLNRARRVTREALNITFTSEERP
jgi:RNA polymerase sigma factor (sigma-70 family)